MNEVEAKDVVSCLPDAPFWMVLGEQGMPVYRHPSREDAEREARRLARKCPGAAFVVLEAVSATVRADFNVVTFRPSPAGVSIVDTLSAAMSEV